MGRDGLEIVDGPPSAEVFGELASAEQEDVEANAVDLRQGPRHVERIQLRAMPMSIVDHQEQAAAVADRGLVHLEQGVPRRLEVGEAVAPVWRCAPSAHSFQALTNTRLSPLTGYRTDQRAAYASQSRYSSGVEPRKVVPRPGRRAVLSQSGMMPRMTS